MCSSDLGFPHLPDHDHINGIQRSGYQVLNHDGNCYGYQAFEVEPVKFHNIAIFSTRDEAWIITGKQKDLGYPERFFVGINKSGVVKNHNPGPDFQRDNTKLKSTLGLPSHLHRLQRHIHSHAGQFPPPPTQPGRHLPKRRPYDQPGNIQT